MLAADRRCRAGTSGIDGWRRPGRGLSPKAASSGDEKMLYLGLAEPNVQLRPTIASIAKRGKGTKCP